MRLKHCGPLTDDDDDARDLACVGKGKVGPKHLKYSDDHGQKARRQAVIHREASVVVLTEYYAEQMARQEFWR